MLLLYSARLDRREAHVGANLHPGHFAAKLQFAEIRCDWGTQKRVACARVWWYELAIPDDSRH